MDLTAHILVGLLIGVGLNTFFKPWGLIVGIVLGFASGIYNVLKNKST